MKSFNMEMENTPLFTMTETSLSLLTFATKQRLVDQMHPTKFQSAEHLADKKTMELREKLEMIDKRLRRGWQLISSKLSK